MKTEKTDKYTINEIALIVPNKANSFQNEVNKIVFSEKNC